MKSANTSPVVNTKLTLHTLLLIDVVTLVHGHLVHTTSAPAGGTVPLLY